MITVLLTHQPPNFVDAIIVCYIFGGISMNGEESFVWNDRFCISNCDNSITADLLIITGSAHAFIA